MSETDIRTRPIRRVVIAGGGGIVVSPIVGASMQLIGADGLPISLAVTCAALSLEMSAGR